MYRYERTFRFFFFSLPPHHRIRRHVELARHHKNYVEIYEQRRNTFHIFGRTSHYVEWWCEATKAINFIFQNRWDARPMRTRGRALSSLRSR